MCSLCHLTAVRPSRRHMVCAGGRNRLNCRTVRRLLSCVLGRPPACWRPSRQKNRDSAHHFVFETSRELTSDGDSEPGPPSRAPGATASSPSSTPFSAASTGLASPTKERVSHSALVATDKNEREATIREEGVGTVVCCDFGCDSLRADAADCFASVPVPTGR